MTISVQISIFVLLILSLGLHEAAHARVASFFGDPTPEIDGVNTWNPIPHIMRSWMWCVIVPAIAWFMAGFFIGGAFVMLNPALMRPRRLGYFCAVAAGPGMNILLSILFGFVFIGASVYTGNMFHPIPTIFFVVAQFNMLLAVFNLIPVPPLDGASMLTTAVPDLKPLYKSMQGAAFYILILVIWMVPAAMTYLFWPAKQFGYLLMAIAKMVM